MKRRPNARMHAPLLRREEEAGVGHRSGPLTPSASVLLVEACMVPEILPPPPFAQVNLLLDCVASQAALRPTAERFARVDIASYNVISFGLSIIERDCDPALPPGWIRGS